MAENADGAHNEQPSEIRCQIAQIKQRCGWRRKEDNTAASARNAEPHSVSGGEEELRPLPARLPRPVYAFEPDLISADDDAQMELFKACEDGDIEKVQAIFQYPLSSLTPAVKQFALETACFAYQPDVARYLLQDQHTELHSHCFERFPSCKPSRSPYKAYKKKLLLDVEMGLYTCTDREKQDMYNIAKVLLESGQWHPNQAWERESLDESDVALPHAMQLNNVPLVKLLLTHGADPHLGRLMSWSSRWHGSVKLLDRCYHHTFHLAIHFADQGAGTELIDLFLASGARPDIVNVWHSFAHFRGTTTSYGLVKPSNEEVKANWERRRPIAEHLLNLGLLEPYINRLVTVQVKSVLCGPPQMTEETALSHAAAKEDWLYAKWLLEHGADHTLLNGRALKPQCLVYGDGMPPSDASVMVALVEEVKAAQAASARQEAQELEAMMQEYVIVEPEQHGV